MGLPIADKLYQATLSAWLTVPESRHKEPLDVLDASIRRGLLLDMNDPEQGLYFVTALNATGFVAVHTGHKDCARALCLQQISMCAERECLKNSSAAAGLMQGGINLGRLESRAGSAERAIGIFCNLRDFIKGASDLTLPGVALPASHGKQLGESQPHLLSLCDTVMATDAMRASMRTGDADACCSLLRSVQEQRAAQEFFVPLLWEVRCRLHLLTHLYDAALEAAASAWSALGNGKGRLPEVACLGFDVYDAQGAEAAADSALNKLARYWKYCAERPAAHRVRARLGFQVGVRMLRRERVREALLMLRDSMSAAREIGDYGLYLRAQTVCSEILITFPDLARGATGREWAETRYVLEKDLIATAARLYGKSQTHVPGTDIAWQVEESSVDVGALVRLAAERIALYAGPACASLYN